MEKKKRKERSRTGAVVREREESSAPSGGKTEFLKSLHNSDDLKQKAKITKLPVTLLTDRLIEGLIGDPNSE